MSRERCLSLDRAQGRKRKLCIKSDVYIPERSPNRICSRAPHRNATSIPDISDRNYGGGNGDKNIVCIPIYNDNVEGDTEYFMQRPLSTENISTEFLDDFEEPSFYDPPPNSSFDEVMCVMATPPPAKQLTAPTAAEKLDVFRTEVANVVQLDDLRKRMAAHIGTSGEDQHGLEVELENVRKRINDAVADRAPEPQKIIHLPEDPYAIPPPPKDPKDVMSIIRRAHAIARLKALEEAKASTKAKKYAAGKSVRGITVHENPMKQVPILPKSKAAPAAKLVQKRMTQETRKKTQPARPQHPPDYVSDEWAAAILRTRKLAGLRTTNPKLLRQPNTPQKSKSPLKLPSPPPRTPTFENIIEKVAAIRSRTNAAKAALVEEGEHTTAPSPQDELDEFEALEELYGAGRPEEYPSMKQSVTDLQNRINALQQQLLQTPPPASEEKLDGYETLEQEYVAPYEKYVQNIASELPAILRYQDLLKSREAMAAAAAEIGSIQNLKHVSSPRAAIRLPKFDDAYLQNLDIPEFDIGDIPEFAFSVEALADAGFEFGNEDSLADISMPDFDDISLDELGVEDITSPDLYDLSISDDNLAIEPDYPLEISTEEDEDQLTKKFLREEIPKEPGFLTSVVNAVVDGFKNIFSASEDGKTEVELTDLGLDTSLPNMFESSPSPKPKTPPLKLGPQKTKSEKGPIIIPPHPKDPKDYKGMVKRAQAIHQKKLEESAIAAASVTLGKDKKKGKEIMSTIPKRNSALKKQNLIQKKKKKVYPPGEYSPSDAKAVARARSLAGLRNLSAVLNPERAAKMAERKAAREAKQAAIEALPPVERMREKMKSMRKSMGGLPRPSIESLATLEAIRANLPKPKPSTRKWRPTGRLRVDRRVKPSERVFWRDFGRVFIPTKKIHKKLDVMSPIAEETQFIDDDLIKFSPLKLREAQTRLRYLKEQAAKRAPEIIRAAGEKQADILYQTPPSRITNRGTPKISPYRLSPIQSPRTEETRREKIITKIGPNGGPETIREEATEISTIENGEIHTSTRKVTTKTDEYGNVTRHVQEGKGLSGEEEAIPEDLADIEPPDLSDISDIPSPSDPSIPTPTEIINRIRMNVQQKLNFALPDIPQSPRSPSPARPGRIDFPHDLPDEKLFDIEIPEFDRTPLKTSPQVQAVSPVERDPRLYAWGELPQVTLPPRTTTPKDFSPPAESEKHISTAQKPKSPEEFIGIPPHPKDPKNYRAMIKRAQAIQKLKKLEGLEKGPPKDSRRPPRKRLVLKKRVPRVFPKQIVQQRADDDMEFPSEPPPLSKKYREAVARARLIHGLKNRTAALNPAVAAKLDAEKVAQAAFDALPEVEKIKRRMEKLRKIPTGKRRFEPSADIIGVLEAIRSNMTPLEEVSRQPSTYRSPTEREVPVATQAMSPRTPTTQYLSESVPQAPMRARSQTNVSSLPADISLEEFEFMEQYMGAMPMGPEVRSTSLQQKLYDYDTPKRNERHRGRQLIPPQQPQVTSSPTYLLAPSMRMLGQARYFQDKLLFDESDVDPASIYYELMEDFRVPAENIVLETSQLMPQTPPRNIQERFQRLKEAQSTRTIPSEHAEQFHETPVATDVDFSPIRFNSPSDAEEVEQPTSSTSAREVNELLINIDEDPEREIHIVKQLGDLEDMPFDELDYESEPNLTDISFEKPLSPPPSPSDILRRARSSYHQKLKQRAKPSAPKSPETLKLPEELPDEELFDLSSPSFTQTPKTPPTKYKSPRVSLPMAWGEVTSATPTTRKSTPTKDPTPLSAQENNISIPEDPIVIPPHPKDSKDYAAIIRRARAIYKLTKQREAEAPPLPEYRKKGRVPISRWQGPPPKKIKKKLVLKKRVGTVDKEPDTQRLLHGKEKQEYVAEPPQLSQEYRDAVAKSRLIHGLKNRTAALNPKVAAKVAAKKAAEEAAAAAFNALTELEKIKVRMERLRRKPHRRRDIKPTIEQIAYLEALKQIGEYQASSPETFSLTPLPVSLKSRSTEIPRPLSLTPRADFREITDDESRELAEFEALEQFDNPTFIPPTVTPGLDLKQRIDDLKSNLLEAEEYSQIEDESLAEFEALEAVEAPYVQHPPQPFNPLDISKLVSDLQQQLVTPPRIDPRERYRQLIAQRKTPTIPIVSPVKTPESRYSPITLVSSPTREEPKKRAEKSTTQITRSGNNTIKEQVIETSEIVDGKLKHFKTLVTTTTDPLGHVTCQINESKRVSARDRSAEVELAEDLGDIQEPSFLDITPLTPLERPRPRDIIDRVSRQIKESYRPEVPTGHLIELRTPPRMLPFPTNVPEEELLDLSYPTFERTPSLSPTRSITRSPDITIPHVFAATPPPPTTPLPASPIKYRIPSPEDPTIIPDHPDDPNDYKTMIRRARKIQQLMEQNKAEERGTEEADASKSKKRERVPISRWTAPPRRKLGKRKKLVIKKRGEVATTSSKPAKLEEEIEYHEASRTLPQHFAKEIALARKLAGLKNRTAALNPKVAAKEAAEAIRKAKEVEDARLAALNALPRSPIKDYATVLSRMKDIKEKGDIVRGQPSLAAAAYLDAVKGAMKIQRELQHVAESPKTRYERILAARAVVQPTIEESPIPTYTREEIPYSPVRFISPRIGDNQIELGEAAFADLDDIEELSKFEQPSYMDFSQYSINEDQYMPLTPPSTPPPAPSDIISRIRQQYEQAKAAVNSESTTTPKVLEFPKNLPEEGLFDLSAPYFEQSPVKRETPIKSPNITIPHYFEESPPARSPTAEMMRVEINTTSPNLSGVFPGIKVKTPKSPIEIPPHPKDPTNVAAMIRRAQLIQKTLAKEAAEKSFARKTAKVRVPAKSAPRKGKFLRKQPPAQYLTEVAKSRRLAGLKNKTIPTTSDSANITPPASSFDNLMERYAALRAAKQKIQQVPTARELTHRQHLINRQQRQERRRLLRELERIRQQQGFEFEPIKTPPPARERLEAIKSRILIEPTISSAYAYSPVKTPEVIDVPQYQPLKLPTTPPYKFLENVTIPDIENISIPLDDLDNYTMDFETTDEEDLEFQLAEKANAAYTEFENDENINIAELYRAKDDFDIAERIKMLKHQLLSSPDRANADILEKYNIAKRIETLKKQLLQTPTQHVSPMKASMRNMSHLDEDDDERYDQQDIYDEITDDFEAKEREYL